MNPVKIQDDVPSWLKGFHGNEYQMLIRKKKHFSKGTFPRHYPSSWEKMQTRMRWLHYELNYRRRNN